VLPCWPILTPAPCCRATSPHQQHYNTRKAANPRTCIDVLRSHVVLLSCVAQLCANKPPFDVAGWHLWRPLAELLSVKESALGVDTLKSRIRDVGGGLGGYRGVCGACGA
jgi:hypothetical protein